MLTTYRHNHHGHRNHPTTILTKIFLHLAHDFFALMSAIKNIIFRQSPYDPMNYVQYNISFSLYLSILSIAAQNGKQKKHCPGPSYVACSSYLNGDTILHRTMLERPADNATIVESRVILLMPCSHILKHIIATSKARKSNVLARDKKWVRVAKTVWWPRSDCSLSRNTDKCRSRLR